MLKRTSFAMITVLLVVAACGSEAARGLDAEVAAQPTILTPPGDETTVLYPPDSGFESQANIVILIDDAPLAARWQELRTLANEAGGWVSSAQTSVGEYDGQRYEYGTAVIQVPGWAFEDLLSWIQEIGERISYDFSVTPTSGEPTSTIVVTLTDNAAPFIGSFGSGSEGRVDRALDTAGDVLLTMLSVLIVAGAVIVPVVALLTIAYGVWRAIRRRWPIIEMAESSTLETEPESIDS